MTENRLLARLRAGQIILGVVTMYPAAGIVESLAPGWDLLWIDAQHGEIAYADALAAMHAAGAVGIDTMLRVPGHEYGILGPFADLAPSAIMVPMVNTVGEAQAIVRALRFPPIGQRSYGGRRVIDVAGRNYVRESELTIVAQIETLEAVANAPAIAATEGIDVLFFGPDDMRVQLGISMDTPIDQNDQMMQAMRATAQAARQAKRFCGCVAPNASILRIAVDMGYQLIIGGGDSGFIRSGSQTKLAEMRQVKPPTTAGGIY